MFVVQDAKANSNRCLPHHDDAAQHGLSLYYVQEGGIHRYALLEGGIHRYAMRAQPLSLNPATLASMRLVMLLQLGQGQAT